MKSKFILLILLMLMFLSACSGNDESDVQTNNDIEEVSTEQIESRTWQDDCLVAKVDESLNKLHIKNGVRTDLADYHDSLLNDFSNENNLYVEKFKEEYDKLNYESLAQLDKDILNGLMFLFREEVFLYDENFSVDHPIDKAWLVGEGENNTNSQKHRKIVFLSIHHNVDFGVEFDYWIEDGKEYHSANTYHFGEYVYPLRRGINDTSSDTGVWENDFRDYYNNEKYVSLDIAYVNSVIQNNREFIVFMQEYFDIYNRNEYEKEKAEREEEEAERSKEPTIGMTQEEVLRGAWGSPVKKNITVTKDVTHEQWVYDNNRYIYFENGIVVSIQYSE